MAKKARTILNEYFDKAEKVFAEFGTNDPARCLTAVFAVKKELEELREYREAVRVATGSDNYGNALKTIKARGRSGTSVFLLPDELERIPQLWLTGRVPTGSDKGCRRYSLFEAKQEHRRLKIYLEDAWTAILSEPEENQIDLKNELVEIYENNDPEHCALFCEAFTKDYDLEEILNARETEPTKTKKKKEDGVSIFEATESLRVATEKSDYGVGGVLEEVQWD